MSGTGKKKLVFSSVAVDLGCGAGSCRKPKKLLSSIFHPKPKPTTYRKHHNYKNPYFSTTAAAAAATTRSPYSYYPSSSTSPYDSSIPTTAATFSPAAAADDDEDESCGRTVRGFGRLGGESVAVEKDSDDPYLDFRQSMLQMILEKQIYSRDDLRELLNCFLQLNSPYHHGIIVRAFSEIWNGVFSSSTSAKSPVAGGSGLASKPSPTQGWGHYGNYGYYHHGWN
ncbi:unnamed protein product [Linum trigynum]|uniref:Transcription repressor n=1 Tax=Linum trigynum TaxID=586398 RepID=A0AAV2CWF9_9ROSI